MNCCELRSSCPAVVRTSAVGPPWFHIFLSLHFCLLPFSFTLSTPKHHRVPSVSPMSPVGASMFSQCSECSAGNTRGTITERHFTISQRGDLSLSLYLSSDGRVFCVYGKLNSAQEGSSGPSADEEDDSQRTTPRTTPRTTQSRGAWNTEEGKTLR